MYITDRVVKSGKGIQKFLTVRSYPEQIFPGWLQGLSRLPGVYNRISLHFRPAKFQWNWQMRAKMRRLEASIVAAQDTVEGVKPYEARALQGLKYLQQQTDWNETELYDMNMAVTAWGAGEDEALDSSRALEKYLSRLKLKTDERILTQLDAFALSGLLGIVPAYSGKSRLLDGEAAGCFYPFLEGSLSEECETGVYVGNRVSNNSLTFLDLISGSGAKNFLVIGKTGEGKSTWQKGFSVSLQGAGMKIFVIDVDREYIPLARKLGGIIVDTQNSKFPDPSRISAEIGDRDEDGARLKNTESNVFWAIDLLAKGMDHLEKNACDTALSALWLETGIIRENQNTWDLPHGGIRRWYNLLENDDTETAPGAVSLRAKVRIFFRGSQQGLFTEPGEETDLYDNDYIVFDISGAVNNTEDAHTSSIKLAMTFATVWDMVRRERARGKVYTAIFFDEGQRALPVESISDFVLRIATTARKFNSMAVLATNNSAILWGDKTGGSQGGEGLWNNTHYKVFFYMEESEIKQIADHGAVPETVTASIRRLQGTYSYILKTPGGYDRLKMQLPDEELALYRTRGLKGSAD